MKRPLGMLPFLVVFLYLTACTKKAGPSNESGGITGKWNLVSDSTFEGVGSTNHPVNYAGGPGDYFNFSSDGYVYTEEGLVPNRLTYRMVSNSRIIISDFGLILNGVQDTSTITGLTVNSGSGNSVQTIVIESPFDLTPGGEFWRKVTLSR
ncbi:MAG TPA: hypothetical protein VG052_00240 [Puia sp.]|jgi:hypothetical protein|nr:hypothetical protein [Puia sp.]